MKDAQLDRLTTKELKELRDKVEKLMSTKRDSERSNLREKFKQMAEAAGFSLGDIVGVGGRGARGGRSAAAKFINPDDPNMTWSGRGRKPNWLTAKVKAGANEEDFRVSR